MFLKCHVGVLWSLIGLIVPVTFSQTIERINNDIPNDSAAHEQPSEMSEEIDAIALQLHPLINPMPDDCNANGIDDALEADVSILYVNVTAPPGGDGASWATAYADLQDALCVALLPGASVTEIWVATGVYTPDRGAGTRTDSFTLVSGVAVYGGFAGWETDLDQRDWEMSITTLSGDLANDDPLGMEYFVENSYHVVDARGVGPGTVLDGFVIRGGYADGDDLDKHGGGIAIVAGQLTIAHCTITENITGDGADVDDPGLKNGGNGAGVYCVENSVLELRGCTITDNRTGKGGDLYIFDTVGGSGGHGAGLFLDGSNVMIQESLVMHNLTGTGGESYTFGGPGGSGAGIYSKDGELTIADSQITNNLCGDGGLAFEEFYPGGPGGHGAGIRIVGGSLQCWNTLIEHNISGEGGLSSAGGCGGDGGGARCDLATLIFSKCNLTENNAGNGGWGLDESGSGGNGGAVAIYNDCEATIANCIIDGNIAGDAYATEVFGGSGGDGGGIFCSNSAIALYDNEICANVAGDGGDATDFPGPGGCGAGIFAYGAPALIINSSILHNEAGTGGYGDYVPHADDGEGGGLYSNIIPRVLNCIFWNNSAPAQIGEAAQIAGNADIDFSCIEGWTGLFGGFGNGGWDPGLVDPDGPDDLASTWQDNDYRLAAGSLCIDAGCNWSVPRDVTDLDADNDFEEYTPLDLDGEGRFFDDPISPDLGCGFTIVDMGAYEYGDVGPQPCLGDLDNSGRISIRDLAILLGAYGGSDACGGDLTCDGVVNGEDLAILISVYGTSCD